MELKLNYSVPITEKGLMDGEFIIQGTAINATTTSNNHKFLAEELKESAGTLTGVPLLIDHRNEVDAIKGKVLRGEFNEQMQKVDFKAKVNDEKIKELIKRGDLTSVSVGATVRDIEESDDGALIPRGITFKELSLVAVPADSMATFTTALHEAFETIKKETIIETPVIEAKMCEGCGVDIGKMEKHMKECNKSNSSIERRSDMAEEKEVLAEKQAETKAVEESKVQVTEAEEETPVEQPKAEVKAETEVETKAEVSETKELKQADADEKKVVQDPKPSPKAQPEDDDEEEDDLDEKASYKIVQGFGSIRGGSFSVVRN